MNAPGLLPGALGPAVEQQLAEGVRAVGLDVFDTLLWRRTLHPRDAFGGLPHGWAGRRLRPLAEAVVTAGCRRLLGREPRLADIYRLLPGCDAAAEMALERSLTVANPAGLALVRRLQARGLPVLAISDMYLSGAQIAELLAHAGYPPLAVLSSADVGVSKHGGGRLFLRAARQLGVRPDELVHVGDDPWSDIEMARRQGLRPERVQAPRETLLRLRPGLAHRRLPLQASLFWGELALALHEAPGLQAQDPAALAARLQQRLADPAWRGASPQARAQALLEPPGLMREAP